MRFFDRPWPQHHGQPLAVYPERVIQPTEDEALDGVEALGVSLAYCLATDSEDKRCATKFYFYRHLYTGGWAPVHKAPTTRHAELNKRLKMAIESDWVWGSTEDGRKVKRSV